MRQTTTILAAIFVLAAANTPAQEPSPAVRKFDIDRQSSWIMVLVFRSGLFAGLGHNHTVASRDVSGAVRLDENLEDAAITLHFPVELLVLDDPGDRKAAGDQFEKPVSERDIDATRRNMLGERLLHGGSFGEVLIESTRISGALPDLTIDASVTVRGEARPLTFSASVKLTDKLLIASGSRRISHAELGLHPFSAGFGTLRVADQMLVTFHIVGVPAGE